MTKLRVFFYFLLIAVISISEILSIIFPISLLGKNFFLVAPFFIIAFLVIHFFLFKNRKALVPVILCFGLLIAFLLLASFMHLILYNQLLGFFQYRFVFQIALAAALTVVMLGSISRDQFFRVIVSVVLVLSFIQGIGYYFLPEIQIIKSVDSAPMIIFDGQATREGIFGSSLVAYHAVLALFALTSRERISRSTGIIIGCVVLVILASQTRIAIIFMVLILLNRFISIVRVRDLGSWFFTAVFFITTAAMMGGFSEMLSLSLNRFEISFTDDPRILKTLLALNLTSESLSGFLWGLPIETVDSARLGGFQVSDNSFFLVLLRFGFIFCIVWISSIIYLITRFNRLKLLYLLWIFFALFTTNSILWDSFIICLIGMAAVLGQNIEAERTCQLSETKI